MIKMGNVRKQKCTKLINIGIWEYDNAQEWWALGYENTTMHKNDKHWDMRIRQCTRMLTLGYENTTMHKNDKHWDMRTQQCTRMINIGIWEYDNAPEW